MAKAKAKTSSRKIVDRTSDVPITQGMLYGVRDEIKNYAKSELLRLGLDLQPQIIALQSELSAVNSNIHRLGVLIEEQNARNAAALDSLIAFKYRQDQFDEDLALVKGMVSSLK